MISQFSGVTRTASSTSLPLPTGSLPSELLSCAEHTHQCQPKYAIWLNHLCCTVRRSLVLLKCKRAEIIDNKAEPGCPLSRVTVVLTSHYIPCYWSELCAFTKQLNSLNCQPWRFYLNITLEISIVLQRPHWCNVSERKPAAVSLGM